MDKKIETKLKLIADRYYRIDTAVSAIYLLEGDVPGLLCVNEEIAQMAQFNPLCFEDFYVLDVTVEDATEIFLKTKKLPHNWTVGELLLPPKGFEREDPDACEDCSDWQPSA